MAAEILLRVNADPREVHHVLRDYMSHVELVSETVFGGAENYVAILLYQTYFSRVGNEVALMLIVSGVPHHVPALVKSVACASSRDFLLRLDWGAAGSFASEPIRLLRDHYGDKVQEM